ncbi:unnamed protein product [Paramecium octaurelia]|uniref:Protein kinase domain-containing protein n=1 Tax=Paramecium octaurelia TaxID=43137 RepID=A0A8S1WM89_PAROT|nr:unnamed protein product [Paramecium octaurelia]
MQNKIFEPAEIDLSINLRFQLQSKFLSKNNKYIEIMCSENLLFKKSQKSFKMTKLNSALRYQIKHESTSIILRLEKDDCLFKEYLFLDKSGPWEQKLKSQIPQLDYQTYYELEKLIGSGSFASVYIAKRKTDGNKLAVKAFLKKMLMQKDPDKWRESIDNEIKVMKSLDHPSLLKCYDHFENRAQCYISMDWARGGTLEQGLSKLEEPLPFLTVKVIFRQIVEAIKYMHSRGYMHRDLKPSNILLKRPMPLKQFSLIAQADPNIVVSDFGVSSEIKVEMDVGRYCGSPGFMAPEVMLCENNQTVTYNEKCDIFSLGCILYRLITNKPLFNGQNSMAMKQQNLECHFDWIQIQEELYQNKTLTNLLSKLLSIDPKQRPSCEEILNCKILHVELDNDGCPLFINYKKPKSSSIQQIKTPRLPTKSASNCKLPQLQLSPNHLHINNHNNNHTNKKSGNFLLPPINNRVKTEQSEY